MQLGLREFTSDLRIAGSTEDGGQTGEVTRSPDNNSLVGVNRSVH